MTPFQRREAILSMARTGESLRVDEIAERFEVSRETIRRDLSLLDSNGLLRRVHGGAQRPRAAEELPFRERMAEMAEEKQRIARAAAALFRSGDTLMIDTGSTTQAFAGALALSEKFTVITNSIGVALALDRGEGANKVYVIGGEYRRDAGAMLGSVAVDHIAQFRADHVVLTVGAVDATGGFMDFDVEEAMVARAMIGQAEQVTVLADHSKLGRMAMTRVSPLHEVSRLVTDQPPPDALALALKRHGVEIVIAT